MRRTGRERQGDAHITFDTDGMDAAPALRTGTPEADGLAYEEARRFLEPVRTQNPQAGLDLVEAGLLYDPTRITALLANQLRVETLGATF